MSKEQIIQAIQQHNHSANNDFLDDFDTPSLQRYLDRLTHLQNSRGPSSGWIRPGDTPAIVMRSAMGR